MNQLIILIMFLVKCIYLMLPGIFANMAPIIFKNHFKKLAVPVDFYKTYEGRRIFGDNKTVRGFIFGIIFSIIAVYVQSYLYSYPSFKAISFIDYSLFNPLILGLLTGFGVLFGDLVKSFFKRRANIAPGNSFIPWDQLDSAVGGIIFISFVYAFTLVQIAAILLLSFFFSISVSRIGYSLGLRKEKL